MADPPTTLIQTQYPRAHGNKGTGERARGRLFGPTALACPSPDPSVHHRDPDRADSEPRSISEAPKSPRRTRCRPEGPSSPSSKHFPAQKPPVKGPRGDQRRRGRKMGKSQPRQRTPPPAPPRVSSGGTLLQHPTVLFSTADCTHASFFPFRKFLFGEKEEGKNK